jgi:hypothetical protein
MHNREALVTPALEPMSRSLCALPWQPIVSHMNCLHLTLLNVWHDSPHPRFETTVPPALRPFLLNANRLDAQQRHSSLILLAMEDITESPATGQSKVKP